MANKLHFLGNMLDPTNPKFNKTVIHNEYGERKASCNKSNNKSKIKETFLSYGPVSIAPPREYAEKWARNWLESKVFGDPESPQFSDMTVAELKELGYVGVYRSTNIEAKKRTARLNATLEIPYPRQIRFDVKTGKSISLDKEYDEQENAKLSKNE